MHPGTGEHRCGGHSNWDRLRIRVAKGGCVAGDTVVGRVQLSVVIIHTQLLSAKSIPDCRRALWAPSGVSLCKGTGTGQSVA